MAKTDERLDGGLGACWLGEPAIAELVENTILHFDGERYRVLAWCVMPNHVHGIVAIESAGDRITSGQTELGRHIGLPLQTHLIL